MAADFRMAGTGDETDRLCSLCDLPIEAGERYLAAYHRTDGTKLDTGRHKRVCEGCAGNVVYHAAFFWVGNST